MVESSASTPPRLQDSKQAIASIGFALETLNKDPDNDLVPFLTEMNRLKGRGKHEISLTAAEFFDACQSLQSIKDPANPTLADVHKLSDDFDTLERDATRALRKITGGVNRREFLRDIVLVGSAATLAGSIAKGLGVRKRIDDAENKTRANTPDTDPEKESKIKQAKEVVRKEESTNTILAVLGTIGGAVATVATLVFGPDDRHKNLDSIIDVPAKMEYLIREADAALKIAKKAQQAIESDAAAR